jgi:hypothetical protein
MMAVGLETGSHWAYSSESLLAESTILHCSFPQSVTEVWGGTGEGWGGAGGEGGAGRGGGVGREVCQMVACRLQ